jgi:predicted nucleotidyltransferase
MTIDSAPPIEQHLLGMAAAIRRLIPAAEVRLYSCGEAFGYRSRARGEAGPDADVVLLITAPDA